MTWQSFVALSPEERGKALEKDLEEIEAAYDVCEFCEQDPCVCDADEEITEVHAHHGEIGRLSRGPAGEPKSSCWPLNTDTGYPGEKALSREQIQSTQDICQME